jgi:hypothetical protein
MAATPKAVILSKSSDWESWYYIITTAAKTHHIREYINPDLPSEPLQPTLPVKPTASDVNPAVQSVTLLSDQERDAYKFLLVDYKEKKEDIVIIIAACDALHRQIVTSVSSENYVYIKDKTTVYGMLRKLRSRLAPKDYAKEVDIIRCYNKIRTFSKRENVEQWLQDWETIHKEETVLGIPDIESLRCLFHFTEAIASIDSGFAAAQRYHINQLIDDAATLPTIYRVIEKFHNYYRQVESSRRTASHSGFLTLRGESQNSDKHRQKKEGPEKPSEGKLDGNPQLECLCGKKHSKSSHWEDCKYISPSSRPDNWKSNPKEF